MTSSGNHTNPANPDQREWRGLFILLPFFAAIVVVFAGAMLVLHRHVGKSSWGEFQVYLLIGLGIVLTLLIQLRTIRGLKGEVARRRRLENAMVLHRRTAEAASNGIAIVDARDPEYPIVYVNPAFERMTGFSSEEAIGRNSRFLHGEDRDQSGVDRIRDAMREGREIREVVRNYRKNGDVFWNDVFISPLRDEGGEITHFIGILDDVTEKKYAEKAREVYAKKLERLNGVLERQNKELDEFTYIASHDLQEPLRKLIAFSGLLKKDLGDELPETAAKDLHFITDAAKRMETLIRDLLALSRSGRTALKRQRISLNDCADSAMDALSSRIEETGAKVSRDNLPEIWCDPAQVVQLYQNLLGNALKFVGSSSPVVRLAVEEVDGLYVFGVIDNGIGIAPEYQEAIFAPFRRLHGRTEYDGTGIGLSICRKVIERHGGKIWVESEPGKGSTFKFTIPQGGDMGPRARKQDALSQDLAVAKPPAMEDSA
jgi:PAS domain S-box-containing protein